MRFGLGANWREKAEPAWRGAAATARLTGMRSYFFQRIVLGPGIVISFSGRVEVEHNLKHAISFPSLNGFAQEYADDNWQKGGNPRAPSTALDHTKRLGAAWAPE
jgi:hypothetical protein